jgi:hypothetical protein
MGILAVLFSLLAWFSMIIGVVTLLGILPPFSDALTWIFWFGLSGLLFLASISSNMGGHRGGGEEY